MTVEELEYIVHAQDREVVLLKERVDALNRSLDKGTASAAASSNRNLKTVGRHAGRVGLVVTGALALMGGASLKFAAEFQQSLQIFEAVSDATGSQMARVRKEAIRLGADIKLPATSAKDAAQAMTELAKGGLDVETTMKAAHGTLLLSAAAGIENAEAARIQVRTLKAFNLAGSEADRIADLLAASANASTAEISDMADGFQNAAAQASNLGVPVEDLTTALALMADRGIAGARAGVSLKVMMTRFVPLTNAAAGAYERLGIITKDGNNRLFDAQGRFVGLAKASSIFRQAMKGQTQEQRIATLQTIFGQDAQRAATFVLLGGAKAWDKMHGAVTKAGAAEKNAEARNKGLKGAMDAMRSTLETAAIVFGTVLLPAANAFLRAFLIPGTAWLTKHKTATMILSAVLLTLGLGLLTLSLAVKIYTFATAEATASTLAWTASLLTNPIFLIIVALIALGAAMVVLWKKSETFRAIVRAALHGVVVAGNALRASWEWFRANAGTIWSVVRVAIFPILLYIKLLILLVRTEVFLLRQAFEWFRDHAGSIWGAVKAALAPVLAFFKFEFGLVKGVVEKLIDAFKWVREHGAKAWVDLKDGVKSALEKLTSAFGALWDKIRPIIDGFKWVIDNAGKVGGAIGKVSGFVGKAEGLIPGGDSEVGARRGGAGIFPNASIAPGLWDEMAIASRQFGLTLSSGYRPGDDGDHGRFPSHAIDESGSVDAMRNFALAIFGRPGTKDIIYGGLPFWQDNGRIVAGWAGNEGLRRDHLDHVHASIFDNGGWLPPGLTLALNKTGVPERVIGPGGESGVVNVYVNVEGSVTTKGDLVREIHEGLKTIDRRNVGVRLRP